jgi:hypothetical protein
MSAETSEERKDNVLTGALRRAGILGDRPIGSPKGLIDPTLSASYKPPIEQQIGQIDRGEAWWRDFSWEEYATKELPGLGLGFTVYPYVAVWEKIWGAVPTEDYQKYKQYYTQEPFIRATIDFHTQMTISQGYELEYPLKTVVEDVKKVLARHNFIGLMSIMIKDMLVFGNSYTEVVRTWFCQEPEHDLESLRISYQIEPKNGHVGYWWTDRVDVADKHNKLYPDHKLENPYGEITRFKPLDPMYMRVRRDAYGTILGYVQYYVFPLVTFLASEIVHLRYMPTSWTYESVYGVSMLRPILFHQELVKNYEQTMGQIMNVFLRPMFIVRVGGQPGQMGVEVSDTQYRQVKRLWAQRITGQDIVIKSAAPLDIMPIDPPIDRMQSTAFWLQWLHNMRTYALSVPKFFTDPAGLNRATAQTVERGYFTFISSNRQHLDSQLEEQVMKMILQSLYGKIADEIIDEYGVPKFIWKPVKEDSLEDKAKTYLPLYASRILTKNEVRKALGFEEIDEDDLQEELGATLPPIGGPTGAPMGGGETPTFASPDEKMAQRPPQGGAAGMGDEKGFTPYTDEGRAQGQEAAEFARQEESGRMEELMDELEMLKEDLATLKNAQAGLMDMPTVDDIGKDFKEMEKRLK